MIEKNGMNEMCVDCHKELPILRDTTIHNRFHYIEGAGQLCAECYAKTYLTTFFDKSERYDAAALERLYHKNA